MSQPVGPQSTIDAPSALELGSDAPVTQHIGVPEEGAEIIDAWGAPPSELFFWIDKVQFIGFKPLTHGDRTKYDGRVNRQVTIDKKSGDAKMAANFTGDKDILLDLSITSWHIRRNGQPVPFSKDTPGSNLAQWLKAADPRLVDKLYKAVAKANPWLESEMTVAELEEQIQDLKERQLELIKAQESEGFSESK